MGHIWIAIAALRAAASIYPAPQYLQINISSMQLSGVFLVFLVSWSRRGLNIILYTYVGEMICFWLVYSFVSTKH